MDEQLTFDELVDRAVERLLDGEPVDAIVASYPAHAADLAPVLRSADLLMTTPRSPASAAGRMKAMRRMFDQVEATDVGMRSGGGIMAIFRSFRGRPLAFQGLAAAGALVLFGALGLGASAATGTTPAPVRDLLRISSNSVIHVEFTGTVVSVEPAAGTLTVSANGDIRTVVVTAGTEVSDSGDPIVLDDIAAGQTVEVEGALQPDNSIVASKVHVEDDDETPEASTPTAAATAPAAADDDGHDDDEDDDREGEDDGDQGDDDDSSGPGSDDDDIEDEHEDNSGPGSGDIEEQDDSDDHEGGSSGDDVEASEDDHSGSSDGDEEEDSGSGGGDDEADE